MKRKYKLIKHMARVMLLAMVWEVVAPVTLKALTSGPSQPEVQGFTSTGTGGMVDPFTGDFQYSIPLLELPGPNGSYPFTLGYQSGIKMDQEASWVGLGWNLNVGSITREMRGLPDEFAGDEVKVEQDMRADWTVGVNFGKNFELFGADFNLLGDSAGGSANVEVSVFWNRTKGPGFSLDADFLLGSALSKYGVKGAVGAGVSLNSQEGVGFSPQIGLSARGDTRYSAFFSGGLLGANYNSRQGLTDLSIMAASIKMRERYTATFSQRAFLPQVQFPIVSTSINGKVKGGPGFLGNFPNATLGGTFSYQTLIDKKLFLKSYGYQNLENAGEEDLMDFNRYQDGALRRETPNLPTPVLTHDNYHLSGSGVGGSFRAWRNDVGIIHDRKINSGSGSADLGFEVGGTHAGFSGSFNASYSSSGKWENKNDVYGNGFGFEGDDPAIADYEPWYFKMVGEGGTDPLSQLDHGYGTQAVRIKLNKEMEEERQVSAAEAELVGASSSLGPIQDPSDIDPARRPRNTIIQAYKNDDLTGGVHTPGEYQVSYYDAQGATSFSVADVAGPVPYDRGNRPGHHFAGMTVTQGNGMRYVYALPAINQEHVENLFSVDGSGLDCEPRTDLEIIDDSTFKYKYNQTDQMLNRKEIPEYAHAYQLTSVLGQDYVDADDIPGPSDGDLGFWVRFNYVKTATNAGWRAPFAGANLDRGQRSVVVDDKGSYLYGEKEIWYLASAETKTHIAEFFISRREDARGAAKELQNEATLNADVAATLGSYSYQLDTLALYSKIERENLGANAKAIQKVVFDYDYSLCQGAWNNGNYTPESIDPDSTSGKLTLKTLHFLAEDSYRGALHNYEFEYGFNPDYDPLAQDKWGCFKPYTSECEQFNYPYVDNRMERDSLDKYAQAWNLNKIVLPQGGEISVTYEADDYGFVQDKPAMRMFEITRIGNETAGKIYESPLTGIPLTTSFDRRIYFRTDEVVSTREDVEPYAKGLEQVYIKALIDLKGPNSNLFSEFVPAYFEIDDYGVDNPGTEAYIELAPSRENGNKWAAYHPLALAGWHYLRANLPQLVATPTPGIFGTGNVQQGSSQSAIRQQWQSLASMGPELIRLFQGYYLTAFRSGWAENFDPNNSWIRLNDPDRNKVGGGCRVRMITVDDGWGDNPLTKSYSNLVGVVYDYSKEENGQTISSGVAQYEPMVGGDESPMKVGKSYPASVKLRSPNRLFFEYPINEPYMPGAHVGYSKVTIKSLATQEVLDQQLSATVPTTGAAIQEFYTSRDYPVLTGETPIENDPFNLFIPIPFVGSLNFHDLTASQGYSIVLNDMHGKPRRSSNYGMTATGELTTDPISWVEYHYQDQAMNLDPENPTRKLVSQVETLKGDVDPSDYSQSDKEERFLGQDEEFFLDMRESVNNAGGVGFSPNVDNAGVLLLPSWWPSVSYSKSLTRTVVANKIIHRTGILKGMTVYNEGSKIETDHLLYDAQTGRPLLSQVENNYGDPVYSYQYPAFWAYPQMGPAYKNIGLEFEASGMTGSGGSFTATGVSLGTQAAELLVPGDEVLVRKGSLLAPSPAVFTGFNGSGDAQFYSPVTLSVSGTEPYEFKIVRSGRRNLLGVNATEITALKDPTRNRDTLQCWRDLAEPATIMDTVWSTETTVYDTLPAGCVYNWINLVNIFLQSGIPSFSSSDAVPPGTEGNYCLGTSTYEISVQADTQLVFVGGNGCEYLLLDGQGNAVNWSDVLNLGSPQYVANVPFASPTGYGFSNIGIGYLTNAGNQTGYLFTGTGQDCQFNLAIDSTVMTNYYSSITATPNQSTRVDTLFMLDSVLSASAQTFSDGWSQTWEDLRFETGNSAVQLAALQARHGFANGQRGIWRPHRSYVYVDDRQQSADLNLAKDGTFSGLPMFNFQSNFFESCGRNWRRANEVTRYSPFSYELENRDVLDIYSAALYGYNGKLATAVASNADFREIGFESFEEYDAQVNVDVLGLTTGNLDFQTDFATPAPGFYDYGEFLLGDGTSLFYDQPLPSDLANNTDPLMVYGRTSGNQFDPAVNFAEARDQISYSSTNIGLDQAPYLHQDEDSLYTGWVGVYQPPFNPGLEPTTLIEYSSEKAHTGKRSLKWEGNTEWIQNRLALEEDEQYAIQAWVSRTDTDVPFYRMNNLDPNGRLGILIRYYDATNNVISTSSLLEPAGHVIEGWQKIEGNITIPQDCKKVSVVLQSGRNDFGAIAAYIDDIRLQPKVSSMTCYVYDTGDYRLRATLDDNNYALIYQYDEGGNLYLVQKETNDGIRTIQESRGFLAE